MTTTCVICKHGTLRPGATTLTLERGDTVLVIRNVPADVCEVCDEAYIRGPAVEAAEKLLDEATAGGVRVEVRDYAA